MSRDGKAASKGFGRRQEDRVTPEERIYPLQFILDYVQEKKNTLLALEGSSLHQALRIRETSHAIGRQMALMRQEEGKLTPEQQQLYELLKHQQEQVQELTVGLTRKGLAFEDMDNMLRQAQPFILRLIFKDTLTDTYNRYFFISRGEKLMREAEENIGFSLAFFDIDKFKACNDTYGHEFGDAALKYLSSTINEHLKQNDLHSTYFVRMGGDEFILISNELAFPHFVLLLDDLQRRITGGTIYWEQLSGKITVSVGAANSVFGKLSSPWDVYREADTRLYNAKEKGRNCIVSS